ncbi:MAG: ABC transporter ATP-binding protein [Spirochaetaceae bacterium]|jgi:iron complex transport system ATP-binding protein|nr:ABC transporter ATP-binding protein [Spirochaetaceae bacterium]
MSLIEARNAAFSYRGGNEILQGISFSVECGEHIALVGPNGSGKTTLISLLAGLEAPTRGEIFLNGVNLRRFSAVERARRIARLAQGARLPFPFTCFEAVLMGLHPHWGRFSPPDAAELSLVEELMRETDTWGFAGRKITELSGGEAQRVFFTRALVQAICGTQNTAPKGEGRLLLLDEPFSELDIAARIAMMKLLNEKAAACNLAVIGIHHDLHIAARFAGRVLALKNGLLAADGSAATVFTPPFFAEVFKVRAEIAPHAGFCFVDTLVDTLETFR